MSASREPARPGTIHHLLPCSPYSERFLRFLAQHPEAFPPAEHRFWVEGPVPADAAPRTPAGAWGFLKAFRALGPGDRVIIHQLSNPRLLLHLFLSPASARRCAWQIWGGDVYFFRFRSTSWADSLREWLRHRVIPRLPVVSSLVRGDFDEVRRVYGSRARYVSAFYPIPMDEHSLIPDTRPERDVDGVTLLVGNSADPANEHAWVLRSLARFRAAGVRILAPLAYGDATYVASVIALGRELFGDQFTPLTEFLPPEQYARLLGTVDAAIMNHGHQQALGNLVALLLLGKKVYVRSDTTSFGFFHDLGVAVDDTLRLPQLSLAELAALEPTTGARNADAVRALLSEARAVAGWRELIRTLRALP